MAETRTIDLYDTNEGKVPRTGGPYLDKLQREEAEKWRAKAEDREPDYDNPPATAATQLVTKDALRENDTDKSHFSDKVEVTVEPVDSYEYTEPVTEPDPKQVDWNNDSSQVAAAEAKAKLDEAQAKNESTPNDKASDEEDAWDEESDE